MANDDTVTGSQLSTAELASANRLLADYARLIDSRRCAEWQALWGVSGRLAFGGRSIAGDDLAEFARNSPPGVHVPGLPHLERRPDGSLSAESSFVFVGAADGAIRAGYYVDELVLQHGEYVFASRTIDMRAST